MSDEIMVHVGHRLALTDDSEMSIAGLLCETCGEYLIEFDDEDAATPEVDRLRDENESLRRALEEATREIEHRRRSGLVAPRERQAR